MWQRNYFHSIYSYVLDWKILRCQRQYVHSEHFNGADRSKLKKNYHEEVEWKTDTDGAGGFPNEQKNTTVFLVPWWKWLMSRGGKKKRPRKLESETLCAIFYVFFFSVSFILLFYYSVIIIIFFPPPFVHTETGTHSLITVCILHVGFLVILPFFMTAATAMTVTFSAALQLLIKLFHCSDERFYKNADWFFFFHFSTSTAPKMTFHDDCTWNDLLHPRFQPWKRKHIRARGRTWKGIFDEQ